MHFDSVKMRAINEERRMVYGPAMIPDKHILRLNDQTGEEFYVTFPRQVVEKMSHRYFEQNHHQDVTIDHEYKDEDVKVVESWIKEGSSDKSIAIGMDEMPDGTWFIGSKVKSDDTWEKVKDGSLNGYSIEAEFKMIEMHLQSAMNTPLAELEQLLKKYTQK